MINIQDGAYYNLGRKTFIFFVLQNSTGAIGVLFLAIVMGIIGALMGAGASGLAGIVTAATGLLFVVAVVVEIGGIITARLKYNTSRVMLDNSALHVVKGILSKSEVAIPYRRLQSVAIKQSVH